MRLGFKKRKCEEKHCIFGESISFTNILKTTPFEIWKKGKLDLKNLQFFGLLCKSPLKKFGQKKQKLYLYMHLQDIGCGTKEE